MSATRCIEFLAAKRNRRLRFLCLLGIAVWAASLLQLHLLHTNIVRNQTFDPPALKLRVTQDGILAADRDKRDGVSGFYQAATIPIPEYTADLAEEAVRPSSWRCGRNGNNRAGRTLFWFVHVYKAAGTTLRRFFHELAYACRKTWASLSKCTGVRPLSLRSNGRWMPCMLEEVADGRKQIEEQYMHPRRKNYQPKRAAVRGDEVERQADIIGGHTRIGTGDHLFSSAGGGEVRYIIFLRDPMERYVSGVLYQYKVHGRNRTLDQVVRKIKEGVRTKRDQDRYMDKSLSYILTPHQRVANEQWNSEKDWKRLRSRSALNETIPMRSTFAAETRCELAIQNLVKYNAIVGFTERMAESLHILKHVFLNKPEEDLRIKAEEVFAKFGHSESMMGDGNATTPAAARGFRANKSHKATSTTAVMAELRLDREHMRLFEEYVKYEQRITDFAWEMHKLQHDAVLRMTTQ